MGYEVILHPDQKDGFWVECPTFEGCYSEGDSVEESLKNIQEAIELCLECLEDEKNERPKPLFSSSSSNLVSV